MRKKVLAVITTFGVLLLLLVVINPQLGSYIPKGACSPAGPLEEKRLTFIKGETLVEIKSNDRAPGPTEGCRITNKYVQYIR